MYKTGPFAAFSSQLFGCFPEGTLILDISRSFPRDPVPFKVARLRYAICHSESGWGRGY